MVRKYEYRRNLPHLQRNDKPLFVSFCTYRRWELPPVARDAVFECCRDGAGRTIDLYAFVVMPDHVHLLFTPLRDENEDLYSLPEIMQAIKGASAHKVNRALSRKGQVWQEESFDHVTRSEESLDQKADYILMNPVRKGLVQRPEQYRWSYRK